MALMLSTRFTSASCRVLQTVPRSWTCASHYPITMLESSLKVSNSCNITFTRLLHSLKNENVSCFKKAISADVAKMVNKSLTLNTCRHMCYGTGQGVKSLHRNRNGTSLFVRFASGQSWNSGREKKDVFLYILSFVIFCGGLAYAGVPLFKLFCRQFGFGGNPEFSKGHDKSKVATMQRVDDRVIKVYFEADRHAAMRWNFQPQQREISIKPGETALAFYTAENPTDKSIIGISTYTVTPYKAAPYFNKIQCFCFEEQILNPHEKVDMPVFFYIDPDYDEDPDLEFDDEITLSYTFFEVKDSASLPLPGFMTNKGENEGVGAV